MIAGTSARAPKLHLVDTTMFWANESGGVKRYLQAKRDYLSSSNWQHTIVTPGTLTADSPQVPGIPLPFSTGYRLPLSKRSARKVLLDLKPDLIEAGDPYQLAWAALAAGQESHVPVVAFYHSDLPELAARVFGPAGRRAATAYARKLYERFDQVFAPSIYALEHLENLGVTRAIYQPLGVNTEIFHPGQRDENWKAELGIARDTKVLLYVGRFAAEKNLDVLFEAVEQLGDDYVLVAVGSGPLASPAGRKIYVLPYESDTRALARIVASADIFVHAGDQETFGLVALEAMACGLPVVASARGGLGELVSNCVGYTVEQNSAEEFAEAIAALSTRDTAALSLAARNRALTYDWRTVFPQLESHYRGVVTRVKSGAIIPDHAVLA